MTSRALRRSQVARSARPAYGACDGIAPFTIQSDGSFQGTYPYTLDNGTGTLSINGNFAQDGTASGTISDTFTFSSGDFGGVTCMSTGTWTAKVSP